MSVKDRAALVQDHLIQKTRSNGESYLYLKDVSPQWMKDLIRAAHTDPSSGDCMPPDDWRYKFIDNIIGRMAESSGDDERIDEEVRDCLEADIYTNDLFSWISSNITRLDYCNELLEELQDEGVRINYIHELIMDAQLREQYEVYDSIKGFLMELSIDNAMSTKRISSI